MITVTVTLDPAQIASQLEDETCEVWTADEVSHILGGQDEAGILEKLREGLLAFIADARL